MCLINYMSFFFFFNDTATTEIYTLSLHDALPICLQRRAIPQSLDQYSGDICALPASGSALSTQGGNYDASPFTSHCGFIRFGRAGAVGQREKHYSPAPTAAPSVPPPLPHRLPPFH